MASHNTLSFLKVNSHAKMAPDTSGFRECLSEGILNWMNHL